MWPDAGRYGTQWSGIKEEPREGRGTAAELSAMLACVLKRPCQEVSFPKHDRAPGPLALLPRSHGIQGQIEPQHMHHRLTQQAQKRPLGGLLYQRLHLRCS